jgi:hypothetical protein
MKLSAGSGREPVGQVVFSFFSTKKTKRKEPQNPPAMQRKEQTGLRDGRNKNTCVRHKEDSAQDLETSCNFLYFPNFISFGLVLQKLPC